jgi:hypothetical protein
MSNIKEFTKEEIEGFYLETMQGFYLNEAAKNGGSDAKDFYQNELSEFTSGFECCMVQMRKQP